MIQTAVVPGTFDPITRGHLDVILRAASLFERVIVGVASNPAKSPLLGLNTRIELIEAAVRGRSGIEVTVVDGLLVDFCRDIGAAWVVKGMRGSEDFPHEAPMALINRQLGGVDTIFLAASPAYAFVSSSIVKDIAAHGGDVERYVTSGVSQALHSALR
jgi:pantetheine-phosphate adenylyltransferase